MPFRLLFTGLLLTCITAIAQEPLRPRVGELRVGDLAPTFELKQLGQAKPVKLVDLRGKPVVLVFGSCT
jgi:cytochrome oxidase Cu insertion factor (SCO1/SenC/PrrC family)